MDYIEKIKFRTEIGRELLNSEVDDNFRYVANPWVPTRSYKMGMIVFNEIQVTGSDYILLWFIAKQTTTAGEFISSEWEPIGPESLEAVITSVDNAFSQILVNSTSSATLSTTNNTLFQSSGEDLLELAKGDGIQIEHDISKKYIKISTDLNPSVHTTTHILTLGGETVDLSSVAEESWQRISTTISLSNAGDNVVIGDSSAGAKLDVNGTFKVRSLSTGSTNDIITKTTANIFQTREINSAVWDTVSNFILGSGIQNYIVKWTPDGSHIGNSLIFDDGTNVSVGHAVPLELLDVGGAIKVGSTSNDTNGSIRYTGTDFEGKLSGGWTSLTEANMIQEDVEDWVGSMLTVGNTQTGITLSYVDGTGKINAIVDSFTIDVIGDATGSVTVDWSLSNYDLDITLGALNITLGTQTTGNYVQDIAQGQGILVTGGVGEGSSNTIATAVDGTTIIKNGGTGAQLSVLKVPNQHTLAYNDGLSITNQTTSFDGSATVTHSISLIPDIIGGANLATAIDINTNGIAVKIDDLTIIQTTSGELTVGIIDNVDLTNSSITINSNIVELGDFINLTLEDIYDIEYPSGTPLDNQILRYNTLGYWEPTDEATVNFTGTEGNIMILDGVGNSTNDDAFNYDTADDILTIDGKIACNEISIYEDIFSVDGDFENKIFTARNTTTDASITELFIDGTSAEIYVSANSVLSFRIKITGIRTGGTSPTGDPGDSWLHEFVGALKYADGTLSVVGTEITETTIAEDLQTTNWDASVTADNTNKKIKIDVSGEAFKNIRWGAMIEVTIIKY